MRVVGGMAGSTGGHEIPVLTVGRVPIQVHGGQADGLARPEIEERLASTTPPTAMTVWFPDPSADHTPIDRVAPDVDDHHLLRRGFPGPADLASREQPGSSLGPRPGSRSL